MIVTEEEAKTKWCPEVRSENPGEENMYCIGSACMAWRWNPTPALTQDRSATHGYCGKAGKP